MLLVGFSLAWALADWRARRVGVSRDLVADALVVAVLGGVVGARLLSVILFPGDIRTFWDYFKVWEGGLEFFGGLLVATVALLILLRARQESIARFADLVASSIAAGLIFGRIGCFLFGCCWGQTCAPDFSLGVRFPGQFVARAGGVMPEGSPAFEQHAEAARRYRLTGGWHKDPLPGPAFWRQIEANPELLVWREGRSHSLWVHPTQLYSSSFALALCLILNLVYRFRRRDGDVFLLFGLLYPIGRFYLETIRADSYGRILGLTDPQVASLLLFVVCVALLIRSRRLPRRQKPAPAVG